MEGDTPTADEQENTTLGGDGNLDMYEDVAAKNIRQRIWLFTQKFEGIEKKRRGAREGELFFNIDDVYNAAVPEMSRCGIGSADQVKMTPDGRTVLVVEVYCLDEHAAENPGPGQYQRSPDVLLTSELPLPTDGDGRAFGSALTYMRRYGLVTMLNIIVPGEDDDGFRAELARLANEVGSAKGKPINELYEMMDKLDNGRERGLEFIDKQFSLESFDELSLNQCASMRRMLKGKIREAEKGDDGTA